MALTKPQCHSCHSHTQEPTLSGRDAESFINHACAVLRSIYGLTPDNHPDPRLCTESPPPLTPRTQGLYFPEPLAVRQPTVSWYIANLAYYARASAGVFHTAIAYLERAQARFKPDPSDPRTAFVAALILAHRFLEDGSYKTDTWARLSGSSARMISACVETMFDALEHRLWIGPLPTTTPNTLFSMRDGMIFSEELGGQRRCSLPSLSVLYRDARSGRAFGDPQSVSVSVNAVAGPSTATVNTTIAVPKAIQGLPSPPASPASASGTPPPPPSRARATSAPQTTVSDSMTGHFNYAQWQSGDKMHVDSTRSAVSLPPPPPPHPSVQHPHLQRRLPPPPLYTAPRIVQPDESPIFDVAQWCAPVPDMDVDMHTDISPPSPSTPSDTDAFNPLVWAAQSSALVTPALTQPIAPEKSLCYPRATLMPPLDPAFYGRRHSR